MASRQTDKEKSITRVYKYGIVPKGPFPQEAVMELRRANHLWNRLVELDRDSRARFDEARRKASKPYRLMAEKLDALNEQIDKAKTAKRDARQQAGTKDASHPLISEQNDELKRLFKESKTLRAELKPIAKDADKLIDTKSFNKQTKNQLNAATRASGLYNTTAWDVLAYFKTAKDKAIKDKGTLRKHRFDGAGFLSVRFRRQGAQVDGVFFDEMFLGNQPIEKNNKRLLFISRDDSRKKPRIRMRATLAGGVKKASRTVHEFDLIYHRDIPEGGQIQNGKIIRSRIGDRFTYHLVLTVKFPKQPLNDVPNDSAIGIDIGFRLDGSYEEKDKKQNGKKRGRDKSTVQGDAQRILIATIFDGASETIEEIYPPFKMMEAMEYLRKLEREIDDEATELGKMIKPLLKAKPFDEDHSKYGLWKAAARYPNNGTLSSETAYKLARWVLYEAGHLPQEAEKEIVKWWRSCSRKYREKHNLSRKQLSHRKHFYREVAQKLVANKLLIAIEKIDLRQFAETKDADNDLKNKARSQRFDVAPSEFIDAIKNAATRENVPWVAVNPRYTSKDCSACGARNNELGSEKEWRCKYCGVSHDRDANAARNIAMKGLKQYFKGENGENREK